MHSQSLDFWLHLTCSHAHCSPLQISFRFSHIAKYTVSFLLFMHSKSLILFLLYWFRYFAVHCFDLACSLHILFADHLTLCVLSLKLCLLRFSKPRLPALASSSVLCWWQKNYINPQLMNNSLDMNIHTLKLLILIHSSPVTTLSWPGSQWIWSLSGTRHSHKLQPILLLTCFGMRGKTLRTKSKPTWIWREHETQ